MCCERAEQVASKMAHKESCRAVCFSGDGNSVFSGAADGSIRVTDPETGAKVNKIIGAHESGVSRLLAVKEGLVAAGDDDGCIKVCTYHNQSPCCSPLADLFGEGICDQKCMVHQEDSSYVSSQNGTLISASCEECLCLLFAALGSSTTPQFWGNF